MRGWLKGLARAFCTHANAHWNAYLVESVERTYPSGIETRTYTTHRWAICPDCERRLTQRICDGVLPEMELPPRRRIRRARREKVRHAPSKIRAVG